MEYCTHPSQQGSFHGIRIILSFLLIVTAAILFSPKAYADKLTDANLRAYVNGSGPILISAYDADYENNTFVSLRSMSAILNDTAKAFSCSYSYDEENHLGSMLIYTGQNSASGQSPAASTSDIYSSLQLNHLVIDDAERHYWTYAAYDDLYISLTDFAMAFDIDMRYSGPNLISLQTDQPFIINLKQLQAINYFDTLSGVVIGDITSGEILFADKENDPEAIASTTKLMTCLLAFDAIEEGRISLDDTVTISGKAAKMSRSGDGLIPFYAGQRVSLYDLIVAMMLPSSNESCIAIAEYIDGGEAVFVDHMNRRAKELGLTTAHFYNATGLPYYRETAALSKSHNNMSAMDLYTLAKALVDLHPEVTEITSYKTIYLESMDFTAYNSNPLLYNLPDIWGLKTGTTNRAGCCMVSLMKIDTEETPHLILCVLLDAETSGERCTKSELLLRSVRSMYSKK